MVQSHQCSGLPFKHLLDITHQCLRTKHAVSPLHLAGPCSVWFVIDIFGAFDNDLEFVSVRERIMLIEIANHFRFWTPSDQVALDRKAEATLIDLWLSWHTF